MPKSHHEKTVEKLVSNELKRLHLGTSQDLELISKLDGNTSVKYIDVGMAGIDREMCEKLADVLSSTARSGENSIPKLYLFHYDGNASKYDEYLQCLLTCEGAKRLQCLRIDGLIQTASSSETLFNCLASAPNLTSLCLCGVSARFMDKVFKGIAISSSLQELSLHRCHKRRGHSITEISESYDFSHLRKLTVKGMPYIQLLDPLFRGTTGLSRLDIDILDLEDEYVPRLCTSFPKTLKTLNILAFRSWVFREDFWIENPCVANLQYLRFEGYKSEDMVPFVQNSLSRFQKLRTLDISKARSVGETTTLKELLPTVLGNLRRLNTLRLPAQMNNNYEDPRIKFIYIELLKHRLFSECGELLQNFTISLYPKLIEKLSSARSISYDAVYNVLLEKNDIVCRESGRSCSQHNKRQRVE